MSTENETKTVKDYKQFNADIRKALGDAMSADFVIAIRRPILRVLESMEAAAFFSQCVYWGDKSKVGDDGWFYKTADEWMAELCLPRRKLEEARDLLFDLGLIDRDTRYVQGVGKVNFYRANQQAMIDRIVALYSKAGDTEFITKKSGVKAKKGPDPRSNHPAVQMYRHVAGKMPDYRDYCAVISTFGENPGQADEDKLREIVTVWRDPLYRNTAKGSNHSRNPNNTVGMLDWFRTGIPEYAAKLWVEHKAKLEKDAKNGLTVKESAQHFPVSLRERFGMPAKFWTMMETYYRNEEEVIYIFVHGDLYDELKALFAAIEQGDWDTEQSIKKQIYNIVRTPVNSGVELS